MKRLKIPKLGRPRRDDGEYRAKHRSPLSHQGRKLRSAKGRHRAPDLIVPPHSENDRYAGRHRKGDPPPSGKHRQRPASAPGRRQSPADDRDPAYFRSAGAPLRRGR